MVGARHDGARRRPSRTAAAIASANRSRPRPARSPASCARRSTCTIIGSPRDVGERLAGQAGRGHAGRDEDDGRRPSVAACGRRARTGCNACRIAAIGRLYGLPEARQTGYLCAADQRRLRRFHRLPPRCGSPIAMDSFELNKILGAVLGTCLCLLSLNIAAGAIFLAAQAGQAGLRDRGARSSRRGGDQAAPAAAGRADRGAARHRRRRARRDRRQEVRRPATPSTRAGRTRSARISTASSAAPKALGGRLQLFGGA